ncbi:hypothetical protein L585_16515 [Pantoea ananatis BRT175]|nr:hypothetical protein L585_16515 [Pantoea ananatis BRT175]PKC40899.1 hypothetical protein V461_20855 [Pantoea ananatis BRT98]CCF09461.1 hypothetical protein PANA5342_2068 [Pantoea ananatis LMG 5342]
MMPAPQSKERLHHAHRLEESMRCQMKQRYGSLAARG